MNLTTRTLGEIGNVGSRVLPGAAPQNAQDITFDTWAHDYEGVVITDMRESHTTMCT